MAIKTNLTQPFGEPETWKRALENGRWTTMRGHEVLMLGASDYVLVPKEKRGTRPWEPVIMSVNGDQNPDGLVPFGVRWGITQEDIDRGRGAGSLDALAIEQFRLRGYISPEG